MEPGSPPLLSARLLDQVRERARYLHYSLSTEVLGMKLPWMDGIKRPGNTKRIPSVLTKDEVAGVLALLHGETASVESEAAYA